MADAEDAYLIWSHEHRLWWGPGGAGYVERISQAGRYSRAKALEICAGAIPGTARQMRALPELPVRLADVTAMQQQFNEQFPGEVAREPWA